MLGAHGRWVAQARRGKSPAIWLGRDDRQEPPHVRSRGRRAPSRKDARLGRTQTGSLPMEGPKGHSRACVGVQKKKKLKESQRKTRGKLKES